MPRYFFHIDDGATAQDDEGAELDDVAAAKCVAVRLAGQMICDGADRFWDREEWKLTATDSDGLTLFCLHVVGVDAPVMDLDPNLISAEPVNREG
jgi:hypothetical protein